jgi:hypothetical protein
MAKSKKMPPWMTEEKTEKSKPKPKSKGKKKK